MLEFELIKNIIEYIKSKYHNVDVLYNMTTNGILLKKDIVKFMVENNVNIAVSLDGYKENHDRNRVFVNGDGTFDIIIANLSEIRENYPNYFYNNLSILVCYDWKTDLFKMEEFFTIHKNELPPLGRISLVSPFFTNYYVRNFSKGDFESYKKQLSEIKKKYFNLIIDRKISPFLEIFIGSSYRQLLLIEKITRSRPVFILYTSTCIPGSKLCVDVNGEFHVCEKVNYSFPIGDVYRGIDYNSIVKMLREYKKCIMDSCKNCPITRLCSMCFATFMKDRTFDKDPPEICDRLIDEVKKELSELYKILEENPSFNVVLSNLNKKHWKNMFTFIDCEL